MLLDTFLICGAIVALYVPLVLRVTREPGWEERRLAIALHRRGR